MRGYFKDLNIEFAFLHAINNPVLQAQTGRSVSMPLSLEGFVMKSFN
jgi:hypothetical protein